MLENRESGTLLKQQAVLFRTSSHSGPLEVELTRRNIPFVKFGGLKFLDAAHIKDMLALLRFVENPRDRVAGFRLMHLIPGVGPASAQKVLDYMAAGADPMAALRLAPAPPRAGDDWTDFIGAIADIRRSEWPADIERARLWYEPHLDRIHEDAETRRADLIQLEQIASGYPSRERFLTELTLDPPDATSDQAGVPLLDEDYLILSTIHSAKGQEWKSVYVLNVVDGCMPSDLGAGTSAEIEEERRLLYVAMTRAKDDLHLMVPQRFFTHGQSAQGDRHVYAVADPLHSGPAAQSVRKDHMAAGRRPEPRPAPQPAVRASTSAPACAACGADCRAQACVRLSTPLQHGPEIGTGALRLAPRGFRRIAETEIAVDQAGAMMILRGDTGRSQRVGIGLALVAQGIEPRRSDHRRRKSGMTLCAQRRNPPIRAMSGVVEIVAAEPFHHRARQEVAFRVFRA